MLDLLSIQNILQGYLCDYLNDKGSCKFATLETRGGGRERASLIESAAKTEDY